MTKKTILHIASLMCVIHCVFTPFLLLIAPVIGHYFKNIYIEIGLLTSSIIIGLLINHKGYCSHKKRQAPTLFILGAIFWTLHYVSESLETGGALLYLIVGTLLVLASYYLNHKYLKNCPSECCNH